MIGNENEMKFRGENKVLKAIITKEGNCKNIASTQIGQQMLFEESLRILPLVSDWIENGSAKVYRAELKEYFCNEEILLEKITQTLLFLSGAIYYGDSFNRGGGGKTRHKKVNSLKNKIMPELSFDQVWRFLEIVIELSEYFSVEKVNEFKDNVVSVKLSYVCNLSPIIVEKLAEQANKAFYPMPMTEAPTPWFINEEGEAIGGYKQYQFQLIRANPKNINYSKFSEEIFESINYIQSTPWIVNKDLLEVVKNDLVEPKKEDFVKMEYPDNSRCQWEIDLEDKSTSLSEKEINHISIERKMYRELISLYRAEVSDFESAVGKYRAIRLALSICDRYKDEPAIYFPHSYDFRGRVYPLPIGLSPQGSDAVKALLLYKDTEPLNEMGVAWNWAYLASLYGDDKLDFTQRVKRGKELLDADYRDADEPYQFLSHQLELKKGETIKGYIPNTRIHLDACNSGSQFTSAITGDVDGCKATNVIPSYTQDGMQERKDAYLLVSAKALQLTQEVIDSAKDRQTKDTAKFFKRLLEKNGRKICKVPVMVSNYGGTQGGRTEILWNMLRELGVERRWITRKNAALFSKIIGDSIVGVLKGGKAFETYIHKMNNIIAKKDKSIVWTTGDGFQVVHVKNKELKPKQVTCMLPGARRSTTIIKKSYSDSVSATKMKSAISPNYIHSLDAELLRRVALKMKHQGMVYTDWIHDSFGCRPNDVEAMMLITKQQFSELVKRDPLKILDQQLKSQMDDDKATNKALRDIKLPTLKGFDVTQGDLDVVFQSDWFFS